MAGSPDHNKIIKRAAGEVLKPLGLFQQGRSRLWVDDNGWFLTLVEFQPSGWSKGSYLNVAVYFLWEDDPSSAGVSFDFPPIPRQGSFQAFTGDEADFYDKMTAMARQAAQLVLEYRRLQDLSHAKQAILAAKRNTMHDISHKMKICALTRDPQAERYYHSLIVMLEDYLQHAPGPSWVSRMLDHANDLGKIVSDSKLLQAWVVELINERRDYLRAKPSYKKLDPAPFPPPVLPPPKPRPKKNPWWPFERNSNS